MNANLNPHDRTQLVWPVAGIVITILTVKFAATNPFYTPHLSLEVGIAAWFADMALVLILLVHPITARIGILLAGFFFAVPCFLWALPLPRGLLMCCMALPFAIAVSSLFAPPAAGFRTRLAFFFTWGGTQTIKRRAPSFDIASLLRLIMATLVFAAALACVKTVSTFGLWLLVRWLAGGIMVLAFAEMVTAGHDFLTALTGLTAPALMRSPFLSTSIGEFWTKRWNVAASALAFRPLFFAPFARCGIVMALFVTFFASALAHMLIAYMAMCRWKISLVCGAFFLVQPLLILTERRLNVRRWPTAAARVWTLTALAVSSPLFVEPLLQFAAPSWGAADNVLLPTIAALGFAIIMNVFFSAGQLASCPKIEPA